MTKKYSLALDFHENSKKLVLSQSYNTKTQYKIYPAAKAISLEKNNLEAACKRGDSYLKTLLSRKSTRSFTSENIALGSLSQLLTLSCGLRNDSENAINRTYASAGARFPVEVYIIILRSDDLEPGIYHFNVSDNSLEFLRAGDYTKEIDCYYENQKDAITTDFPCLILFSMAFDRTMEKYGERGYRFIFLDAGHMGQNLYLTATYLELGIVALGAGDVSDNKFDDMIGLVHSEENVFYAFAVGHPQIPG